MKPVFAYLDRHPTIVSIIVVCTFGLITGAMNRSDEAADAYMAGFNAGRRFEMLQRFDGIAVDPAARCRKRQADGADPQARACPST